MNINRRNFIGAITTVAVTGGAGILVGSELEKRKIANKEKEALEVLKAKYLANDLPSLQGACNSFLARMEHINKSILNIKNPEDTIAGFLLNFIISNANTNDLGGEGLAIPPDGNIHRDTIYSFNHEIVTPRMSPAYTPSEVIIEPLAPPMLPLKPSTTLIV